MLNRPPSGFPRLVLLLMPLGLACGALPPPAAPGSPVIERFAAETVPALVGAEVRLVAVFRNADDARVEPDVGSVESSVPFAVGPLARSTTFTLVVRTGDLEVRRSLEVAVSYRGRFRVHANTAGPREGPVAVSLPNGSVLFVGGSGTPYVFPTEVFRMDPATEQVTPAGSLRIGRTDHTATVFGEGSGVLIIGGNTNLGLARDTEIYDPHEHISRTGPATVIRRLHHAAVTLADGRVLVTGGLDPQGSGYSVAAVEVYEPERDRFHQVGSMAHARAGHTATLLADGRVLVAGGYDFSSPVPEAELFDPATESFGPAGTLRRERNGHLAVGLVDGRVLLAGGTAIDGTTLREAELFDPNAGGFSPTGSLATPRFGATAVLLTTGEVLVVGGMPEGYQSALDTAERFDPQVGLFLSSGRLGAPRSFAAAAMLPSGRVAILGGLLRTGAASDLVELFD